MRSTLALILLIAPLFAIAAPQSPTDPLSSLKPGQWYEVPNSHLEAVAASPQKFPWLKGNIGGVTACWAGGAFDTQRDRLYVGPGGGHAGYNGNEVYAFDLADLKWHRLTDPDPVIPGTEYTDLNKAPFAMHTYDAVEYLPPPVDRYVVVGGWGTPRTYALNPNHPEKWEVYPDHGTGRTGDLAAYDPIDMKLWLSTPITSGKLSQWNPLTHQWTLRLSDSPHPSYYETADIDWQRRLLVSCGKNYVKTWALAPFPGPIKFSELKTTGPDPILNAPSPGFCYVPQLNQFVAWAGGPDVYTLDLETNTWTKHPPADTNTADPGKPDQWGTFGRFRYIPSKNLFIVCNATNRNVFLYKLNDQVPNVITAVQATLTQPALETHIPSKPIHVLAQYADKTTKPVADKAHYVSLDPQTAQVDPKTGVITPLANGTAKIQVTYTDPAYKRGYSTQLEIPIQDIVPQSTLQSIHTTYPTLTIVAGDTFPIQSTAAYTRGQTQFTKPATAQCTWTSSAPEIASVQDGIIKAIAPGEATITATLNNQSAATKVTVTATPQIHRINFQVKETPPRQGWQSDNGQPFKDAKGYGWLDAKDLTTRDDRGKARHPLLRGFVYAKNQVFKLSLPPGQYVLKLAMGDTDYGAAPFEKWVALGEDKLIYYEGHHNTTATRIIQVANEGLLLKVNGPINYLVAVPIGTDLEKYANDALEEK